MDTSNTLVIKLKALNDIHLDQDTCLFDYASYKIVKHVYQTVLDVGNDYSHRKRKDTNAINMNNPFYNIVLAYESLLKIFREHVTSKIPFLRNSADIGSQEVTNQQHGETQVDGESAIEDEVAWDDIQFKTFLREATNLNNSQIKRIFYLFDTKLCGRVYFDAFFVLTCILVAIKDGMDKIFVHRHSKLIFKLLDQDGSGTISCEEFLNFGHLFNFSETKIKEIFGKYDILTCTGESGATSNIKKELELKELEMIALEAIEQKE
ncbi:unnamed protein product [Gordionus sp. m RMFG-2023]